MSNLRKIKFVGDDLTYEAADVVADYLTEVAAKIRYRRPARIDVQAAYEQIEIQRFDTPDPIYIDGLETLIAVEIEWY